MISRSKCRYLKNALRLVEEVMIGSEGESDQCTFQEPLKFLHQNPLLTASQNLMGREILSPTSGAGPVKRNWPPTRRNICRDRTMPSPRSSVPTTSSEPGTFRPSIRVSPTKLRLTPRSNEVSGLIRRGKPPALPGDSARFDLYDGGDMPVDATVIPSPLIMGEG